MERPSELCRPEAEGMDTFTVMPSFRSISGRPYIPDLVSVSPTHETPCTERFHEGEHHRDDGTDNFEFAFVSADSLDWLGHVAADELISNGCLRPAYHLPCRALVSNGSELQLHDLDGDGVGDTGDSAGAAEGAARVHLKKLVAKDWEMSWRLSFSSASSGSDGLDRDPADTHPVRTPKSVPSSPDPRKKSQWRFRDLVAWCGRSEGRENLVLAAAAAEKRKGGGSRGDGVAEVDVAAAHQLYYAKVGAAAQRRSSFLPYRKDLLGLFATGERRGPRLSRVGVHQQRGRSSYF